MPAASPPSDDTPSTDSDHGLPSYEDARTELREIVARLETGGQSLEDSLALWERGEQLADICQKWLDDAGQRLEQAIGERDAGE